MLGRKLGMMRLYDGAGRARAVTVIRLGPNRVTQVRSEERDGYAAVQIGFAGDRKRLNRPARGHLRAAGGETLTLLREFPADDPAAHEAGDVLTAAQFEPGVHVNVRGTSKGRGFAGGVRRWGFRGGPRTHGQSDRHRAPGSIGAGTTPGKVWKGQKMAGHMGARAVSVLNLLVVATDEARGLIFVEGSAPGPPRGIVEVTPGRKPPLGGYEPPAIPPPPEDAPDPIEAIGDEAATGDDAETIGDGADEAVAEAIGDEEAGDEAGEPPDAAEAETGDAPDGGADGAEAEERPGGAEGG